MKDPVLQFKEECGKEIKEQIKDEEFISYSKKWMDLSIKHRYSYHFSWMGRPIIQYPQDVLAMQELIWKVKPDLIIETGIAHGGSLIFYASMLKLLNNKGMVIGIDIEIRDHNRKEIEKHAMYDYIQMIEGSSIENQVVQQVRSLAQEKKRVMVVLDSCHTHEHVKSELELYAPFVTKGSYIIVFDTIVNDMLQEWETNRPWGKNNNPKTAVLDFLKDNERFVVDREIEDKLLITVAPSGYLKCIMD